MLSSPANSRGTFLVRESENASGNQSHAAALLSDVFFTTSLIFAPVLRYLLIFIKVL